MATTGRDMPRVYGVAWPGCGSGSWRTRLAGVDGVTFEAAKWEAVLHGLGHEIRLCAGELDALPLERAG